jgi:toxin ParE1/3/4
MDYQVILSPTARDDLRSIVRYISYDSPDRARRFGHFLIARAKELAQFPRRGREVPELGDPVIREIIVRSYRVVYRLHETRWRVEIIRFWHAARGAPEIR